MDIQDLFGPPINVYTEEQAIEDGILHHLWPDRWPWLLVTNTVFSECERVADHRGAELNSVLIPLILDAIMETQRQHKLNPRTDLVELEHTAIGTVWIRPNGKGGMTLMKPEDN
jgi:hypothetical protein